MSDGSIVFDTKIDNKGFEKGAENIKTKVKGVVNSITNMSKSTERAYNGISSSQMSLMNRIDKTKGKIDELKSKIETLENAKVETDEFKEIQTQIANANKELQKLQDKKAKKEAVGVDKNSKSWKSLITDIQAVKRVLAEAKEEKKQLEATGQAYKVAGPTSQTQAMKIQVGDEQQKLDVLNQKLDETRNRGKQTGNVLTNAFKKFGNSLKGITSKLISMFKKSNGGTNSMVKGLTRLSTLIKTRLLRGAINVMINSIKAGFNNLVQYSSELNASISSLKSSFTQFNNSLATAFAPVIQALVPIIESVINKMIEAMNVVAQFTARLFGNAKTFTKAKKINEDYAKSLKKTNKEQGKFASFDTVEQIDKKSDGDGTTDPSEMFEIANIEASISDFVDRIKNAISGGDWYGAGAILAEKVNGIVNSIDTASLGTNIGSKFSNVINLIYGFLSNINWEGIGTSIGSFLNNAINSIDFLTLGKLLAMRITILVDTCYGLFKTLDWSAVGIAISDVVNGWFYQIDWAKTAETISMGIIGLIDVISNFIVNTDWRTIGNAISTFLANIDWTGIIAGLAQLIGTALGGLALLLYGFIEDAVNAIGDYFSTKINEAGGNVALGLLNGIVDGLKNLGQWIIDNIATPLINGVKSALGINSPSTVFAELGGFLSEGLLNGLTEKWESLKTKVSELCTGLVDKVKNLLGIHSPSTVFAEVGGNITEGLEQGVGDGNGAFDALSVLSGDTVDTMKEKWAGIGTWFAENVTSPIESALDTFSKSVESTFTSITDIIKVKILLSIDLMNILIDSLQVAMDSVVTTVNKIIKSINETSDETGIYLPYAQSAKLTKIPIPKLATGTVVPANNGEFLAMLGDNKRETEIVSPLSTMKQALIEALVESGGQNITIEFEEGSIGDLVRLLKPHFRKEEKRVGSSMRVTGGAY